MTEAGRMRKPTDIERLYLDFDGFFASVMQQVTPALRGRPVGVVPFEVAKARFTVIIACSKEAKAAGVKNVMPVVEALKVCPDLHLVEQRPDLFVRAHNALLAEIRTVIPIETIKSIDELSCVLTDRDRAHPHALAEAIKERLHENVGPYITASIGMAPNRFLAKIACKMDKPNGVTVWRPDDLPAVFSPLTFDDVPGVGSRLAARLQRSGIHTVMHLWAAQPRQLRYLWRSVAGERFWYALHGYEVQAAPTVRGMFGHGRVLPPEERSPSRAIDTARILLTKAARRMRREGYYAGSLFLWASLSEGFWSGSRRLYYVQDDQACLSALMVLWSEATAVIGARTSIKRLGVTLGDLVPAETRQLDLFLNDDADRQRWETLTNTIDRLNHKYASRVVTIGAWRPPMGAYTGGKIAFTRKPDEEDFW
ncbi:MAG: type VI secretion protein ImpB [Pseudomonadota bacterium]